MSVLEFEKTIESLLAAAPEPKPPPSPNFFDISGFPHYEQVVSNWYAFFFDPEGAHGLGDLFLIAIQELINEKWTDSIVMDSCSVQTEYFTKKGNSVDIVLLDEGMEEDVYNNAIIIENKVKADLYNDLKDYYRSVSVLGKKVGVVLSLKEHDLTKYPDFVSITHEELLGRVKGLLGDYWIDANEKYLGVLKDFIQNLESFFTTTGTNMDNIKFYFEHVDNIEKLLALKKESISYVTKEVEKVVPYLNWDWSRLNKESVSLTRKNGQLMLYVLLQKLFKEKKFELDLWLRGVPMVKRWSEVSNQFDETPFREKGFVFSDKRQGKEWKRFGYQPVSIDPDFKNIEEIGAIIQESIAQYIDPMAKEIERFLFMDES